MPSQDRFPVPSLRQPNERNIINFRTCPPVYAEERSEPATCADLSWITTAAEGATASHFRWAGTAPCLCAEDGPRNDRECHKPIDFGCIRFPVAAEAGPATICTANLAPADASRITKPELIDVRSCFPEAAPFDRDILRVRRLARAGLSRTLAGAIASQVFGEARNG
jgi:hypothetical protein